MGLGDVFDNDYDLITLRSHVDDEFLDNFKEAVSLYLSGDWYRTQLLLPLNAPIGRCSLHCIACYTI